MYNESELKWAINKISGRKTQLPPKIYNNPFRMNSGNWQIIEAPVEFKPTAPVSVNIPTESLTPSSPTQPKATKK